MQPYSVFKMWPVPIISKLMGTRVLGRRFWQPCKPRLQCKYFTVGRQPCICLISYFVKLVIEKVVKSICKAVITLLCGSTECSLFAWKVIYSYTYFCSFSIKYLRKGVHQSLFLVLVIALARVNQTVFFFSIKIMEECSVIGQHDFYYFFMKTNSYFSSKFLHLASKKWSLCLLVK